MIYYHARILCILFNKFKRKFDRWFFLENWEFFVLEKSLDDFLTNPNLENTIFSMEGGLLNFYADCFILNHKNCKYIFAEEFSYFFKKGSIVWYKLSEQNILVEKGRLKGLPNIHLSFPFIFQEKNKFYAIFETSENKNIALYEIDLKKGECKLEKILVDNVKYLDVVIHKSEDCWFMFASCIIDKLSCELHLFHSKNLFSEWGIHPKSPICFKDGARMAGKIIKNGEKLIRVGQISRNSYGEGVRFFEIENISIDDYKERKIKDILAKDLKKHGLHTFNIDENIIALDTKVHIYSCIKPFIKIARYLYKVFDLFLKFLKQKIFTLIF